MINETNSNLIQTKKFKALKEEKENTIAPEDFGKKQK